jgi:hypothetical protein
MNRNKAIVLMVVALWTGVAHGTAYREMGYQYLSPLPEAQYVAPGTEFVTEDATDHGAQLEFHLGGSDANVYIDNVSLKRNP